MKVNIYDFHFNKILNYNFFFSKFCETYILLPDTIEIINHTTMYCFVLVRIYQNFVENQFMRSHDKGI